jgi:hypothetical protein
MRSRSAAFSIATRQNVSKPLGFETLRFRDTRHGAPAKVIDLHRKGGDFFYLVSIRVAARAKPGLNPYQEAVESSRVVYPSVRWKSRRPAPLS